MAFHAYQSCQSCVGGPRPGTSNLMKALIARYTYSRSLGIYACRSDGAGSRSIHACGRAGDSGIPLLSTGRANTSLGNPIVQNLIKNSTQLGLMGIIWNRVRYDARSPGGRYYTGVNPHYDHIHWEQVSTYANSLTYTNALSLLGGGTAPPAPPPTDWTQGVIMALPTVKRGNTGAMVKRAQGLLLANGFKDRNSATPETATDGIFGPGTETAAKAFQKSRGLTQDGIIGRNSWTKLLGQ